MFNAILPLPSPIVAVQVDAAMLDSEQGHRLLAQLQEYFMRPVVLAAWDENAKFICLGEPCSEGFLLDESLDWRPFELPEEPEIPF